MRTLSRKKLENGVSKFGLVHNRPFVRTARKTRPVGGKTLAFGAVHGNRFTSSRVKTRTREQTVVAVTYKSETARDPNSHFRGYNRKQYANKTTLSLSGETDLRALVEVKPVFLVRAADGAKFIVMVLAPATRFSMSHRPNRLFVARRRRKL